MCQTTGGLRYSQNVRYQRGLWIDYPNSGKQQKTVNVCKCEIHYPPASDASKEVANFTNRKNTHPPIYCVENLPDCLSQTWTPNIFELAEYNEQKIFQDIFAKKSCLNKKIFGKGQVGPGPRAKKPVFFNLLNNISYKLEIKNQFQDEFLNNSLLWEGGGGRV